MLVSIDNTTQSFDESVRQQLDLAAAMQKPILIFLTRETDTSRADSPSVELPEHAKVYPVSSPESLLHTATHVINYELGLRLNEQRNDLIEGPYLLLPTSNLIGRQDELDKITATLIPRSDDSEVRICGLVGIGGIGKSAIAWKWFTELAPPSLFTGHIWWSFYASHFSYKQFIRRLKAYLISKSNSDPLNFDDNNSSDDQLTDLVIAILSESRFLICLDGIERTMEMYGDAKNIEDDRACDLPSELSKFLTKLARNTRTSVLFTSRIWPMEIPQLPRIDLEGLSKDESMRLWTSLGNHRDSEMLDELLARCSGHPLTISVLASAVRNSSREHIQNKITTLALTDVGRGSLYQMPIVSVRTHILDLSFAALIRSDKTHAFGMVVLSGLRASRISYDLAQRLLAKSTDSIITRLSSWGLIGFDEKLREVDIHPIVKGQFWERAGDDDRQKALQIIVEIFTKLIDDKNASQEECAEKWASDAKELVQALLRQKKIADAVRILDKPDDRSDSCRHGLADVMIHKLSQTAEAASLLEQFKPWENNLEVEDRIFIWNTLGLAYRYQGKTEQAKSHFVKMAEIAGENLRPVGVSVGIFNTAVALRTQKDLKQVEEYLMKAIRESSSLPYQQAKYLAYLGRAVAQRGQVNLADRLLQLSRGRINDDLFEQEKSKLSHRLILGETPENFKGVISCYRVEAALHDTTAQKMESLVELELETAKACANRLRYAVDLVRLERLNGEVAFQRGRYDLAITHLDAAIKSAQKICRHEEEYRASIVACHCLLQQGQIERSRLRFEELWGRVETERFQLLAIEGRLLLALIENKEGRVERAKDCVQQAFWACGGRPYRYTTCLVSFEQRQSLFELASPLMLDSEESHDLITPEFLTEIGLED